MPARHYRIFSRSVTLYKPNGSRISGGRAEYGHWLHWSRFTSDYENLQDAIKTCRESCLLSKMGYIIYRQLMVKGQYTSDIRPYYKIMMGTDGKLYENFTPKS